MMSTNNETERKSNIELLRIVLMFLIVLFHFQQKITDIEPGLSKMILRTIGITGGAIGVNCFIIIYSWFNESNYCKNLRKSVKISLITIEYLIIFFVIGLIINPQNTLEMAKDGILQPLWLNRYWYVTAFVFLMLLSPFVDLAINAMSNKQHKILCCCLLAGILASIFLGHDADYIKDIWLFITLYVITKYIKTNPRNNKMRQIIISVGCWIIVIACNGAHSFIPGKVGGVLTNTLGYAGRYSILLILPSFSLFQVFFYANTLHSKRINHIASLTFGVYLFHENPVFNVSDFIYSIDPFNDWKLRIIYSVLSVILIFCIGLLFERIRKKILGSLEEIIIEKVLNSQI